MIKRVDHIKLKDSYGNKWALNLIKTFLDDNVEDGSFNTTIGPSATLGSKEMEGFWWTLENSKKRYDHDSKGRLEAMIRSNNLSLHVLSEELDENNPFLDLASDDFTQHLSIIRLSSGQKACACPHTLTKES